MRSSLIDARTLLRLTLALPKHAHSRANHSLMLIKILLLYINYNKKRTIRVLCKLENLLIPRKVIRNLSLRATSIRI